MTLKLFYMSISPPSRAVLLTLRNLNVNVDVKEINLLKGEHLTEEFLKLNPVHQVPVLADDDFTLSESRAIMTYLVNSRQPGCSLYPRDPKRQAIIDQRLYYDATVVFERNAVAIRPAYAYSVDPVPKDIKDKIKQSMTTLNTFLENSSWFAGSDVTLADLSILANVSQIKACGYNISNHSNLLKWFNKCKDLPGFEENQKAADDVGKFFKSQIPNGLEYLKCNKIMSATFYHHFFSPPSRMALLAIRNVKLKVQVKTIDIYKGEQHSPEFLKINPLNQIPAYVEGYFALTESKAIATYVASLTHSPLYPTDLKKRAQIDRFLYFDSTTVFPAVKNIVRPILRSGVKIVDQKTKDDTKEMLKNLNKFLLSSEYFTGDKVSLADIGFLASIGTLKCLETDFSDVPQLEKWYQRCSTLSGFDENEDGAKALAKRINELLEQPLWP